MDNQEAEQNQSNRDHALVIEHTGDIVAAFVANNSVDASEIPNLITSVHGALSGLGKVEVKEERPEPAVPIRSSVKKDYIVCLEDGAKLKMLKRYLKTNYDMTPEEYRKRWGLPDDYPMVAPNYSEKRRELAHQIGLGRQADQKRGRKKKADTTKAA